MHVHARPVRMQQQGRDAGRDKAPAVTRNSKTMRWDARDTWDGDREPDTVDKEPSYLTYRRAKSESGKGEDASPKILEDRAERRAERRIVAIYTVHRALQCSVRGCAAGHVL